MAANRWADEKQISWLHQDPAFECHRLSPTPVVRTSVLLRCQLFQADVKLGQNSFRRARRKEYIMLACHIRRKLTIGQIIADTFPSRTFVIIRRPQVRRMGSTTFTAGKVIIIAVHTRRRTAATKVERVKLANPFTTTTILHTDRKLLLAVHTFAGYTSNLGPSDHPIIDLTLERDAKHPR